MNERIVDNEIKLIPYYRNDEASLPWYQDLDVCKQVDNRDKPYDIAHKSSEIPFSYYRSVDNR